jgi:hypothetical protein
MGIGIECDVCVREIISKKRQVGRFVVLNDEDRGPEISHGLNSFLHGLPEFRRTALGDSEPEIRHRILREAAERGPRCCGRVRPGPELKPRFPDTGMQMG